MQYWIVGSLGICIFVFAGIMILEICGIITESLNVILIDIVVTLMLGSILLPIVIGAYFLGLAKFVTTLFMVMVCVFLVWMLRMNLAVQRMCLKKMKEGKKE